MESTFNFLQQILQRSYEFYIPKRDELVKDLKALLLRAIDLNEETRIPFVQDCRVIVYDIQYLMHLLLSNAHRNEYKEDWARYIDLANALSKFNCDHEDTGVVQLREAFEKFVSFY